MSSLALPEYYADLATTTLSTGYTAASGSITVTSAAALSTTRQFHFMITDQTTGAVKCIGKATAVSSNTFTVTMSTDANASSGDNVTISLCAAAMNQIRADISTFGTFASLPATVPPAGARYKQTDGPYEWISNGSIWQAFWNGYPVTLPSSAGWTSEGVAAQSGCIAGTVNYTNGYGYLVGNNLNNESFGAQYRASPGSTPYSFTARMVFDASGIIGQAVYGNALSGPSILTGACIGFRDSGGKYIVFGVLPYEGTPQTFVSVAYFNSSVSYNTNLAAISNMALMTPLSSLRDLTLKIKNDGTNINFYISVDGGQNFALFYSEAITAHLADAANVCWGAHKDGGAGAICLYDWTQGT